MDVPFWVELITEPTELQQKAFELLKSVPM
jgi:hypothetical protein